VLLPSVLPARSGLRAATDIGDGVRLPRGSPPRWPAKLPRGPELWEPEKTRWTEQNSDGLFTCDLIQTYIKLTKGPLAGQTMRLRMWQGDAVCDMLRLDEHGMRVYWTYLLLLPRKNSKSLLGSGLAIDGLLDEPGAEVYSCAADKDQAKIVFGEVRKAIEASPDLDAKQGGLFKVYKDAIEYPGGQSVYKALSAEAFTKEGLNPSRVLFDELHAQPNWELWNVMNQGSDTREQPLIVAISTFGVMTDTTGQTSVCKAQHDYVEKIRTGEICDARYGARVYATNQHQRGFNHRDPKFWAASNPALGDFLHLDKMAAACRKMPEADYRTKRLNIWVNSMLPWLPDGAWDRLVDLDRVISDGDEVVLSFDGSYNNDSTALTVTACPKILDRAGVPLAVPLVAHIDVVQLWEKPAEGTPGFDPDWTVPILDVEDAIRAACRRWQVREIVVDPARFARSYQVLEAEGLPVVEYPQSPARMIPATQRFYEGVVNRAFTQSGDKRLQRHIGNAVLKMSSRGGQIAKATRNSVNKIDLAVTAIMGLDRACQLPERAPEVSFIAWDDL
jgi:phage terminase large subunit-like protein